LNLSKAIGI